MSAQPSSAKQSIIRFNLNYQKSRPISAIAKPRVTAIQGAGGMQLVFDQEPRPNPLRKAVQGLLKEVCAQYPSISIEEEVLGGVPHICNSRVSVDYVLDGLYVLGSIQAVAQQYAPHISETQIREAIGYAQTFMERACEPYQADD